LRGSSGPGSLQHELPLAAQAVVAGSCCRDLGGLLLCADADADAASADLASGALACPSCGAGRLRP
jgi:hypothetical protein